MKISTKRALSIMVSFFLVLGAIIVYASLINPEMAAVKQLRSEIATKKNQYASQKNVVDEAKKVLSKFQDTQGLKDAVSLAVPVSENVPMALAQIQALVTQANVNLTAISFKIGQFSAKKLFLAKRLGTIDVDCEVAGPYDGVKQFAEFLEANVRVANVGKMIVAPALGEGFGAAQDLYKTTLSFQMYYQEQ